MYYITPFEKKEKERKNRKRFLVKMSSYIISDHNVTHMCSYIGYTHTYCIYNTTDSLFKLCVCVCGSRSFGSNAIQWHIYSPLFHWFVHCGYTLIGFALVVISDSHAPHLSQQHLLRVQSNIKICLSHENNVFWSFVFVFSWYLLLYISIDYANNSLRRKTLLAAIRSRKKKERKKETDKRK